MPAPTGFSSLNPNGTPGILPGRSTGSQPGPTFTSGMGGGGAQGYGSVGMAARNARFAMDTLGVPSFSDILGKFGPGGTFESQQFGNAGAAGAGANFAKGELESQKSGLESLQQNIAAREKAGPGANPFGGAIAADRAEYSNPTNSAGFKAAMGLARESTAAASADAARQSAEAAQRRGYAGGYDPRQSDLDRMQALSEAGFGAVKDTRDQASQMYGADVGGYGAAAGANMDRYKTDVGALEDQYKSGSDRYNSALGAFSNLTQTQAELPTKYLSALSPLFSGAMSGPSSFFHDALAAQQGDRAYYNAFKADQRTRLSHATG